MIFPELSNAVFRFVLRCAGVEIDGGGGVQTPPTMGGECRVAGVAVATPTLPVPHQHFALLSLLATPTLTCWLIILCFGHTNFGNHPPPMPPTIRWWKIQRPIRARVKGIIRVSKLQGIDLFYYLLDLRQLANSNDVHISLAGALFWKK